MTPQDAVTEAVRLLEWAEKNGSNVMWYTANAETWDELPAEARRRSDIHHDGALVAAYLREVADTLDGTK